MEYMRAKSPIEHKIFDSRGDGNEGFELSDEEPVDQKKLLEDRCRGTCVKQLRAYEACVDRIKGDDTGTKHCTGQYFDYYQCIDKCVAPKLFKKLK